MAKKVVLAGACRTAIGTMGGGLSTVPAADLGSIVHPFSPGQAVPPWLPPAYRRRPESAVPALSDAETPG